MVRAPTPSAQDTHSPPTHTGLPSGPAPAGHRASPWTHNTAVSQSSPPATRNNTDASTQEKAGKGAIRQPRSTSSFQKKLENTQDDLEGEAQHQQVGSEGPLGGLYSRKRCIVKERAQIATCNLHCKELEEKGQVNSKKGKGKK